MSMEIPESSVNKALSNIDFADFAEPNPEMWFDFYGLVDRIKHFTKEHVTGSVIKLDEDPNSDAAKISGELRHWMYVSKNNSQDKQKPQVVYEFTEASDHSVLDQLEVEGDPFGLPLRHISYDDEDVHIEYEENFNHPPTLYVLRNGELAMLLKSDDSSSLGFQEEGVSLSTRGTPEIMRSIHAQLEHRKNAREHGSDKPTQGTLNLLSDKLTSALTEQNE